MANAYTMTPNPADPFSRWMADYFDEKDIVGVPTGFQSFFGRPEYGGQTLYSPCLLYTSPSPRDRTRSRMPSSA